MPVSAARIGWLRSLGLTEYAAKAYVALLQSGPAPARAVAAEAGVPSGKVYRALEELEQEGLVESTTDTPRRYAPRPVANLLENRRALHEAKLRELERLRPRLATEFPLHPDGTPLARGQHVLRHGRSNVVRSLLDLLASAEEEVVYVASARLLEWWHLYAESLEAARDRGVVLRFLAPATGASAGALEALAACGTLRLRAQGDDASTALAIADRRRAVLAHFTHDPEGKADSALVSEHEPTVALLAELAVGAWTAAGADATAGAKRPAAACLNLTEPL